MSSIEVAGRLRIRGSGSCPRRATTHDTKTNRRVGILVRMKRRVWLRLVDVTQTPIGTFFREVHPGSEMPSPKMI